MKIAVFILLILLYCSTAFAAKSVKLTDGDGLELGTAANPIKVQGV